MIKRLRLLSETLENCHAVGKLRPYTTTAVLPPDATSTETFAKADFDRRTDELEMSRDALNEKTPTSEETIPVTSTVVETPEISMMQLASGALENKATAGTAPAVLVTVIDDPAAMVTAREVTTSGPSMKMDVALMATRKNFL